VRLIKFPGLSAVGILVFFFLSVCQPSICARQVVREETGAAQTEHEPEQIVPGPRDIKEKTAIYVFVGWVWLSVFVLIFFLKLKIRETDRLYQLKFFNSKRK